jgi:hypothetical protein
MKNMKDMKNGKKKQVYTTEDILLRSGLAVIA